MSHGAIIGSPWTYPTPLRANSPPVAAEPDPPSTPAARLLAALRAAGDETEAGLVAATGDAPRLVRRVLRSLEERRAVEQCRVKRGGVWVRVWGVR